MFKKVLIANRGAIACRIERTLRRMGIGSVAVYSEADRSSLHVLEADEAVLLGPGPANQSYLSVEKILEACEETGAEAVHPGYGFLSENVGFARACAERGITFIGPTPANVEAFALKHTARATAKACGVPLLPGTGLLHSLEEAVTQAGALGYPVMLKSSGGGGGIGMRVCRSAEELHGTYESVLRLSQANFGDSGVYLEKFVERARHIEVQIFGDGKGKVIALGERDCSAQRRNQKVLEETPAPGLAGEVREQLLGAAVLLGKAVQYASAGTVEFLYDDETGRFYFLEVNTRLQVEHGVTEQVTGIDLVEWMIRQAAGELAPLAAFEVAPEGASIEARVYAEDPAQNFQPTPGKLTLVQFPAPEVARVETAVASGATISPFYDPMIAKIIVTGKDRTEALLRMQRALDLCALDGTETNLRYLRAVVATPAFQGGQMTTSFLATFHPKRCAIDVLEGGTQTTVQDYPGRVGYWNVGVPPSGPMDHLSFRIANRLVGNEDGAAALEMTGMGARLRFSAETVIALTGAEMGAKLDGHPLTRWVAHTVSAGSVLSVGAASAEGLRAYLAMCGGLEAQPYLGSKSTFILGGFGGTSGRTLRTGDVLHFGSDTTSAQAPSLPAAWQPAMSRQWTLGVLFGPHVAPDFFLEEDIDMLFATDWKVHYQSDRTGVRLVGPKPKWARPDGGEAGLHPSNLHDNAYAVGAVDFTGDMPILLGPDGPSLGGFVCPAVIAHAELWKMGQLKAGDLVRFQRITLAQANEMERQQIEFLRAFACPPPALPAPPGIEPAVLRTVAHESGAMVFRADGDRYLLVEYGEMKLDLVLRFRVHALEQALVQAGLPGIVDITPGVRSLQIHFDSLVLSREVLIDTLQRLNQELPPLEDITVPSRIVHMPLSWDDPQAKAAQLKYMQAVRPDAPWCPSNIEFIRRINGLESIDDVYRIVFEASYLVLGLGDVYLGAPVATPVDPRHRLVTTKYNPARTWTPENAVGIGGAYLCIYGMEGPGGYQLVGRTIQVWNAWKTTPIFVEGKPWSLRFFDQLRFFPVSAEELLDARERFPQGRYPLRIEETSFNLREYQAFLTSIASETAAFKQQAKQAFDEERERWHAAGQMAIAEPDEAPPEAQGVAVPAGCEGVSSPMTASVFRIAVSPGQKVAIGDKLVVLDAMKTEIAVESSVAGTVEEIYCSVGALAQSGQLLVAVRP